MTESIVSAGSPDEQPADDQGGVGDRPTAGSPKLPYDQIDILGAADHYVAGGALLAEMVRHKVGGLEDDGAIGKAEARAIDGAALAQEDGLLGELTAPGQDLADVTIKLAYAWRCAWWGNHGGGVYGTATLGLVASALSDVVLMREAEAQRRHKLGEGRADG